MASFKDLMKALLYEPVEEEAEETEEAAPVVKPAVKVVPVESKSPVRQNASVVSETPAEPSVQQTPAPNLQTAAPAVQPVINAEQETAPEEETSFIEQVESVSIKEPVEEPARPVRQKPRQDPKKLYRYDRSKTESSSQNRRTPLTANDYQAVMSPIFGNAEESKKSKEAVHNAINLPKPDAGFDMVQVISPMYGGKRKKGTARQEARKEPTRSIPSYQEANRHKSAAPGKDLLSAAAAAPASNAEAPKAKPESTPAAKTEAPKASAKTASRKTSDLASFLTREPVRAPKNTDQEESESK